MKYYALLEGELSDAKGWIDGGKKHLWLPEAPPEGPVATLAVYPVHTTLLKVKIKKAFLKLSFEVVFRGKVTFYAEERDG